MENKGFKHHFSSMRCFLSALLVLSMVVTTVPLQSSPVAAATELKEKTCRSFYTDEKILIARENIAKYPWAKELKDAAVKNADLYVGKAEELWNLVPAQSLPRGILVGLINDQDACICPYCGADLKKQYNDYPWLTDPLNSPWKVQCPACMRKFPSNDFGEYYKHGLNEHGEFDPVIAKSYSDAHPELNLLKNTLYPEKGETWCVDDGFGYDTGRTYSYTDSSGTKKTMSVRKTFIAYYIHFGLWCQRDQNPGFLIAALASLRDAYLYTGEAKYGHTGAILLDRIADLYPSYDLYPYCKEGHYNSHQMTLMGKTVGSVWETPIARSLAYDVDGFFPAMSDPEVISFLSGKAAKYQLENKKDTAAAIIKNSDDGILRAIFAGVKCGQIRGNFGMHQESLAVAAVVLNTMPETKEMLDFVFQPGGLVGSPGNYKLTGGNVEAQLVNAVSRDGMGDESSPNYNELWISQLLGVANAVNGYQLYPAADLFQNPKFAKMFSALARLTMVSKYTASVGDTVHAGCAKPGIIGTLSTILKGYSVLRSDLLAQYAYALNNNSSVGLSYDIFTRDSGAAASQIQSVIDKKGPLDLTSENLTAYGLAMLREGKTPAQGALDTQRAASIYYGRTDCHAHPDALNLSFYSYGLDLLPDLAYPETANSISANEVQWAKNTISHNTVLVDAARQNLSPEPGTPLHFDDGGRVKLMDLAAPDAYRNASIYRRSVISVNVNDEVSYGIDFFRVKGGSDHVYNLHVQADTMPETTGLDLAGQTNTSGNYIGSYAGAKVPWGDVVTENNLDQAAQATSGYTWLDHIDKDTSPEANFSLDWKINDMRNVFPGREGLHLRLTSLNDAPVSDVTVANGTPPRVGDNPKTLKYLLIHRSGKALDTLFTTVLEPYMKERYIDRIESVPMVITSGTPCTDDIAKAVKVTLKNGRIDYVMYATNNRVLYRVDNALDFRGFAGVYTLQNGKPAYSYVNDGDTIGAQTNLTSAYNGTVSDFTKTRSTENSITVTFDRALSGQGLAGLANKYIYVNNTGTLNAVYKIRKATKGANGAVVLDIGDVTLIHSLLSDTDQNAGYNYDIATGQTFRIPFSAGSPVFTDLAGYDWAKPQIETLAAQGIINGTSNTTYAPGANITRADFVTLLVRALGLTGTVTQNFSDVAAGDYYANPVGIAKALHILKGDGSNRCHPKAYITRQDMMVMTARALRVTNYKLTTATASSLSGYHDVASVAAYAGDEIATLIQSGIIVGNGNKINPLSKTTRAETAVLLDRILNAK